MGFWIEIYDQSSLVRFVIEFDLFTKPYNSTVTSTFLQCPSSVEPIGFSEVCVLCFSVYKYIMESYGHYDEEREKVMNYFNAFIDN